MEEDTEEITGEQQKYSKVPPQLLPHVYKKGQSGNPAGRPLGISLKEYARLKFRSMTDEEKEEFFNGIQKIELFKMAEGNPHQDTDVTSKGERILVLPSELINKNGITPSTETNS